jgi:thiopeptide-type bacteriocin biosynthesis protein
VNVLVAAASREALARGAYQLVVGPVAGAQAAGRLLGRFSDMLPQAEGELAAILEVEEQLAPGTLCAEIVDVPLDAHGANVLLRTPVAQHEVPVGGRASVPADRVVPLRELVVGVRNDRFYVRWPRKNVDVVLRQGHMLNNVSSIGLVKFLADVSRDGCPVFTGFQWGPAKTFPFLPRVQVGRLVLSLAQWRLSARVVQGELRAGDAAGFGDRLGSWRKHWNVPRHVYLSDQDNRLLLDLEQPAHVEELRREMRCCPEDAFVELQEGLPGPDDAWLEGEGGHYVCELTVSVVQDAEKRSRTASAPAPVAPARELPPRSTVVRPPGSEWLYLKLYVAHFLEEDLISGPVRKFAQHVVERGLAADWFFVRYADPSPHVRLRFRGDAATRTASLVPVVLAWLERLVAEQTCQRFVIDTYDREVERYGGVHGIGLAERIAAIDSAAVAGLLEVLPRSPTLDRADLAVLTVTDLLAGLGLDDDARLRWLKALGLTKARSDFSADYRLRREALLQLLRRPGEVLVERARAGREVVELLRRRKDALAGVAGELETAHREGRLTQPPAELFRSYIHMHLNRLLGINPEAERRTYGLLLRAHESLPHGAPRARPASSSSLEP